MSDSNVVDARLFFGLRGVRKRPSRLSRPVYEVVMLEDLSVGQLMHMLRAAGVHLRTDSGVQIISKTKTPPKDAA